jgi:lysophospholipase L1-like esterase
MYVYPTGDHGFGFGTWFKYHDQMLSDLGNWLKARHTPKKEALRVACIGNSITDGFGIDMASAYGYPAELQKLLGDKYWVKNFGVSSRTMLNKGDWPYMNEQAWRDALAFKPDIAIIKLGTNDSKPENWQYGSEFRQDLEQMLKALPDTKIYLCTPIPAFKPTWNISDSVIVNEIIPIQRAVAKKQGAQIIDLHTLYANDGDKMLDDGIHPDGKGAHRMAEIIAAALAPKK